MKLWRITLSGLRGRKKDTRLLWLVVTLAYLFITLSSTVIACMEATETDQRNKLYGQWQVMVGGSLEQNEIDRLLAEVPGVQTNVLGVNDDFGVVGTINEDLQNNVGFQLLEGRYPENADEIIMESKQLVASGRDLKVGDEVTISIPLSLYLTREGDEKRATEFAAIEAAFNAELDAWLEGYVITGELDRTVDNVMQGGMQEISGYRANWLEYAMQDYDLEVEYGRVMGVEDESGPWNLGEEFNGRRYEDLTEEEQRLVVREYVLRTLRMFYSDDHRKTDNPTNENNLLGMDDVTIRTTTEAVQGIETHGSVDVWLQKTYTDRWDCGNSALPNVFMTEEMGERCFTAMEAVYEMYPYLEHLDFEDRLVFFTGNGSEEDTFRTLLPLYNQCIEDREDAYAVRFGTDEYGGTVAYFNAVEDATGMTVELRAFENHIAVGGYYVALEGENGFYGRDFTDSEMLSGQFEIPGYHPPVYGLVDEDVIEDNGNSPLRINRYAYPISDSGNFMLVIVVAVLFITTMAAVLQIFITQIRRRMQRIAMLKAIGTTNRQTAVMLFFEFLFFLVTTLPVGVGLGLLGAYYAVGALNASRSAAEALQFSVQPGVVLIGMAAGTLALFLGMAVPSLMALRIPLTGRMTVTTKVPARRRESKKLKKQTFFSLVRRNMQANRSRTMGNVALSVFICTIAVLCTYIGYASFEEYRTDVQWADRPDYILTTPAAMNRRGTEAIMADLEGVGEIERIDIINAGENITVTFEGMDDSEFVQALSAAVGAGGRYWDYFNTSMMELAETGVVSDLYTTRTDSDVYARLKTMLSEGSVDDEAFAKGEEVILFMPMYHLTGADVSSEEAVVLPENLIRQDAMRVLLEEAGVASVSARSWAPYAFEKETGVQVGDTISLEGDTVFISESTGTTAQASGARVRVAGIIYYFPDTGLYPLSEHLRGFTVIGSDAVMSKVYPKAPQSYMKNVLQAFFVMNEVYFQDTFGRSYFQLYANENATRENTDFYLESFAKDHAMQLTIYRESNQKLYNAAQNGMLLAAFLGFAAVLLSMLILDNAVASALEQERGRMGILQSMGITGRQFVLQQLYAGFLYAVIGLAAAHVVWLAAVSVFTFITGGAACTSLEGFFACLTGQALWQYPWQIHGIICGLCGVLCILLQAAPMFPLLRYKPIENIKFRK